MTTRTGAPAGAAGGPALRRHRVVLAALALTSAVTGLALLALVGLQTAQTDRLADGTRAVRLSHLAMLDQQTGLRAFLVTRQDRSLAPYRRGRDALPGHDAAALRAFAGQERQLARLREVQRRQRAWIDRWALEALGGVPPRAAVSFLGRDEALFDAYRAAEQEAARAGDVLRERSQARTGRLLAAGLLLELGLLVAAAVVLRRQVRAQAVGDVVEPAVAPALPRPVEPAVPEPVEPAVAPALPEPVEPAVAPALPEPVEPAVELLEPAGPVRSEELTSALPGAPQLRPSVPSLQEVPVVQPPDGAVDPSVLETLTSRLGDRAPSFAATLVQTWRTETRGRLAELETAAAQGDRALAARACHAVKSGSAALGALRLSRACEELEGRLRGDEDVDLPAAVAAVRAEAEAADAAFPAA